MKVFLCFIAVCITVAYCDVKDASYTHDRAYGVENKYAKERTQGYELKDESHGYNDDVHRKAYGSEKQYGSEKNYGYVDHDKANARVEYGHGADDHSKDNSYGVEYRHGVAYNKQYAYHGKYNGHCDNDGFYYSDQNSFIVCSNNNAYVQPCAPGSRNSDHDTYSYGDNYFYRDFCDLNLVDHGYGVNEKYGHDHHAASSYQGDEYNRGTHDVYDHGNRYPSNEDAFYGKGGSY